MIFEKNKFKPGDIVLVELGNDDTPYIYRKKRPAVIVSNVDATRVSPILQIVPLSTSARPYLPTHIEFKRRDGTRSTAVCEHVSTVPISELEATDDWVNITVMERIKEGIRKVFDIR